MVSRVLAKTTMDKLQNPIPGSGGALGVTIIGQTMRVKGSIVSAEEVHLNGELDGQIDVAGRLTIGKDGKANADIKAKEVVVAGSAKGNVQTTERIVLRSGANLEGDVKTAGIVIEDGAYFKGGIDIARPPSS